ncbi:MULTISPECIES: LysR family transcriptional regulator [Streptomyces]|uniref:LysR substrate-binding domain-containing protein n=1 Tax=Streptomyces TaxID=1883 RepID=UPI00140A662E|nr:MULTISPECIES: LysR family transcriptional regulator [Streptomyces]MDH6225556.1 DNA-binding transcriptional LysR family regulator [Streptomyces sp. MJP52]
MELELRHLRVIREIADAGSLTRAATALGLSQPTLSAQLKRIERTLGGTLFERGRFGVRATPLGELVLARTRVVLPAVAELQQEAALFARTRSGLRRLRLGGTHGPLLGGLLARLSDAASGVPVSTTTTWSERELAARVSDGRIDFALVGVCGSAHPPAAPQVSWREIAVDAVHVMLPATHPLAGRAEIDLAELADEDWGAVPGDGCFADCFSAACTRAGFTPRSLYETDTSSVVHLVQVGRALGLARATFPPAPGIVTRPLASTPLTWRHLLGWQGAAQPAPAVDLVLAQARAAHADALERADTGGA